MKSIVVDWGPFWGGCKYFTSNTRLMGGYGCRHKHVELDGEDKERGAARGPCDIVYCPIISTVYREDADDPNIDANGFDLTEAPEDYNDEDMGRVFVDPDNEGYQHALAMGLLPKPGGAETNG